MKSFYLALVLLVGCALPALSQNVRVDGVVQSAHGPAPNVFVAVCSQPANLSVTPCTTRVALCSSLTDVVCTSPNPVNSDGLGNYFFYIPAGGTYTYQFYGTGLQTRSFVDQQPGSATSTGGVLLTPLGDQTIVGSHQLINRGTGQTGFPFSSFDADIQAFALDPATGQVAVSGQTSGSGNAGVQGIQTGGGQGSGVFGLGEGINSATFGGFFANFANVTSGTPYVGTGQFGQINLTVTGSLAEDVGANAGEAKIYGGTVRSLSSYITAGNTENAGGTGGVATNSYGYNVQQAMNLGTPSAAINAAFRASDQGSGANNYGILLDGVTHNDLGEGVTKIGAVQDKAGQVCNVKAYGAKGDASTDDTAFINTAVTSCSGGTVYLPAATYAIRSASTTLIINQAHTNFVCAPGGILQVQSGYQAGFPLLNLQGSASDDIVRGCFLDGNNIAGQGIRVDTTAARNWIDNVEIKNTTGNAIAGNQRSAGDLKVTNSRLHDVTGSGFYESVSSPLLWGTTPPTTHFDDNLIYNLTQIGAGQSGTSFSEAHGNTFSNIAIAEGSLYCLGCDKVEWSHNNFNNVGSAVHCDTCGGGSVSFNTSTNSNLAMADFFIEVPTNMTVEGNVSFNKTNERGLSIGIGGTSQGPPRTQVFSFDSTSGFTAASHVVLTTDAGDKKEGTGSMVATADVSFTTGTLWHFNYGSPQQYLHWFRDLWYKPTSGNLAGGQLQIVDSVSTALGTLDLAVPIPACGQNNWCHMVQYALGAEASLAINGQSTSNYRSSGVRVTTSSPSLAVKFDDYEYAGEDLGNTVSNNKIISPTGGVCLWIGALQGGVVENNYCENPINGTNAAYVYINSQDVIFQNNKSNFSSGGVGLSHLFVDALATTTNAIVRGDDTNAATKYSLNDGGTLAAVPGGGAGGNLVKVSSSDFTTANNTNLQTITGLTWNLLGTIAAQSYTYSCDLSYSQGTANAVVAFGIQAATNSPANIYGTGTEQITVGPPATVVTGTLATLASTTATNIVSGTPGATATIYTVHLGGTIENPAVTPNAINIMVSTATGADAVTVKRGSSCTLQ